MAAPLGGAPFEFADFMVTEEEHNMECTLDKDEADYFKYMDGHPEARRGVQGRHIVKRACTGMWLPWPRVAVDDGCQEVTQETVEEPKEELEHIIQEECSSLPKSLNQHDSLPLLKAPAQTTLLNEMRKRGQAARVENRKKRKMEIEDSLWSDARRVMGSVGVERMRLVKTMIKELANELQENDFSTHEIKPWMNTMLVETWQQLGWRIRHVGNWADSGAQMWVWARVEVAAMRIIDVKKEGEFLDSLTDIIKAIAKEVTCTCSSGCDAGSMMAQRAHEFVASSPRFRVLWERHLRAIGCLR